MLPCVIIVVMFAASAIQLEVVTAYDPIPLKRLATASSLSYLSIDRMRKSPYFDDCGFEPIKQVVDPITESGATIFLDHNHYDNLETRIVVACRGSATPKNFATNLRFNLVPATLLPQSHYGIHQMPPNAMVHEGFQEASVGLWKCLSPTLLKEIETGKHTSIVFTGHSLGASTALLCAVHHAAEAIAETTNNVASSSSSPGTTTTTTTTTASLATDVVTFGGPRSCNDVLAKHITDNIFANSNLLHLVHDADPVLSNNEILWNTLGYETAGNLLKCDPHSPIVHTRKKEDGTASNNNDDDTSEPLSTTVAWNLLDHCKYLGTFVGPRL